MAATSELPNRPASPARARASTTRGAAEAALTVLWHLHRSARRRRRWPGVDTTEGRRSVPLLSTARTMSPCAHDRAHLPLHTHSLKRGTAPNADGAARAQDKHRCHVAARREGWAQEHGASSHAIKRMAASRRAHTIAPCLPRSFPRRTRGQLPPAGARHSLRRVVFVCCAFVQGNLLRDGVNLLRVNLSHMSMEETIQACDVLRQTVHESPGMVCTLLIESAGPRELRVGPLREPVCVRRPCSCSGGGSRARIRTSPTRPRAREWSPSANAHPTRVRVASPCRRWQESCCCG